MWGSIGIDQTPMRKVLTAVTKVNRRLSIRTAIRLSVMHVGSTDNVT
jgi:hypothetical protein